MSKPHQWGPSRIHRVTWPLCKACGLLKLKNEATERAVRAACPGDDEEPVRPRRHNIRGS